MNNMKFKFSTQDNVFMTPKTVFAIMSNIFFKILVGFQNDEFPSEWLKCQNDE